MGISNESSANTCPCKKCECCHKCQCGSCDSCNKHGCQKCAFCCKPGISHYIGFEILRSTYAIFLILMGLDKFFNWMVNWQTFLASGFNWLGNPHATLIAGGIVQIIVGIGLWVKPAIFSLAAAVLFLLSFIDVLLLGDLYNIALGDLVFLLSSLALACFCCCKHKHKYKIR